jgi:hypothetical protein
MVSLLLVAMLIFGPGGFEQLLHQAACAGSGSRFSNVSLPRSVSARRDFRARRCGSAR